LLSITVNRFLTTGRSRKAGTRFNRA